MSMNIGAMEYLPSDLIILIIFIFALIFSCIIVSLSDFIIKKRRNKNECRIEI